jgi:8-amino-7-oxononanoate synthase
MKTGFEAMGYNTGLTQTPIIPVVIGDDEKAFMLWRFLREDGIFANPVIYPAVPQGQALLRTSYSATHSDEELDTVLQSFEKCGKLLGII